MAECFCRVGDIELCYETFGDAVDPAALLIMGLGTQMLGWHDDFCAQLAARGFHVIRTLGQILRRDARGASYTLAEMAADGVGLLDHLGVDRAHLVGASMGGMIAQTIAARRPERVLSLVSIMSTTGSRWRGQPALLAYPKFLRPLPPDRQGYIDQAAELFAWIGSPGFDRAEDDLRELLGRMYDRGHSADAFTRQLGAIIASGNRTAELHRITAPTVVIHGTADRLVAPSGGRATARASPGARLVKIEGMGHDLPRGAWPRILDAIVENAGRAAGARVPQAA